MKLKELTFFFVMFSVINCYSQEIKKTEIDFAQLVRSNFNYDTLYKVSCREVPSGLYASWFIINKQSQVDFLKFSNDSLKLMKLLIENSISRAYGAKASIDTSMSAVYCQLLYFSNISCIQKDVEGGNLGEMSDDSFFVYFKEKINMIEKRRLYTVEESLLNFQIKYSGSVHLLPIITIDNTNPNSIRKSRNLCITDDSKIQHQRLTQEQRNNIEVELKKKMIQKESKERIH